MHYLFIAPCKYIVNSAIPDTYNMLCELNKPAKLVLVSPKGLNSARLTRQNFARPELGGFESDFTEAFLS